MPKEFQNAKKSTGPRTGAGKRRASRNAYSHGLALNQSGAAYARQVEKLARKIAGRTADAITLEHARVAAEAELELRRVRRIRLALIERTSAFGSLKRQRTFPRRSKKSAG